MSKELQHINRLLTDEERRLAEEFREGAMKDFPPKQVAEPMPPTGITQRIQSARHGLGQLSNVRSTVVRAIEHGDDIPLSQLQAVAEALGLTIQVVQQAKQA